MNSHSLTTSSGFHVDEYTDEEIYEWLDLNHPTDRELEARILQMYRIYEKEKNVKMKKFIIDIYNRFFDAQQQSQENEKEPEPEPNNKEDKPNNEKELSQKENNVVLSKNVEYTSGIVNPLLKETITRIVSIDSQFRDDTVYKYSTNYAFNLSETLKNVVSMKLYSVQIPYTWYIISESYGSNFFYIQGNVTGIDTMIYKIVVNNGNTTIDKLIIDVNNSLQNIKNENQDVSFGNTAISYNSNDTRATIAVNIKNTYSTQYYQIEFPPSPPQIQQTPINNNVFSSIYELFGFQSYVYKPFQIYSSRFVLSSSDATVPPTSTYYTVDTSNNFFDIYLYQSFIQNSPIFTGSSITVPKSTFFNIDTSPIVKTIRIELSITGQCNTREIFDEVNAQLQNNVYLKNDQTEIYSAIILEPEIDNIYRFRLQLRLNRKKIGWSGLQENVKMAIVFPQNTVIWTGENSCFKFMSSTNEMNNIIAETSVGASNYVINSSPKIKVVCITNYYGYDVVQNKTNANDMLISVVNSNSNGYTLNDYYNAINTGIVNYSVSDENFNGYLRGNIQSGNDNYSTMNFEILKIISSDNFYLDVSKSFLKDWGFEDKLLGNKSYNITKNNIPNGEIITEPKNYVYLHSTERNTLCDFPLDGIKIKIYDKDLSGITGIQTSAIVSNMNDKFNEYNENNLKLGGCNVLYTLNKLFDTVTITISLNIQAVLTQKDYKVVFEDTSGSGFASSWKENLGFDASYSLATSNPIIGDKIINNRTITLNDTNNFFYVNPIYDTMGGVYDNTLYHRKKYTLDLDVNKSYTTDAIRNSINRIMNVPGSIMAGSYVDTNGQYSIFRVNINKSFTTTDYKIVFYDATFTQCNYGEKSSVITTTADTTLGWLLGFRSKLEYSLNSNMLFTYTDNYPVMTSSSTNIVSIRSDTSISLNLYNYLLLVLDDYTQNHLNDGLVTTIYPDLDIPVPNYVNPKLMSCDPVTKQVSTSVTSNLNSLYNKLTNAQLYSVESIKNTVVQKNEKKTYSTGPYIQDIFGLIPIKTSGMTTGQTYIEFGGALQLQERIYFGPVNIRKLSVKLMTDKGNVINLNGQNWSFSLIVTQLYSTKK